MTFERYQEFGPSTHYEFSGMQTYPWDISSYDLPSDILADFCWGMAETVGFALSSIDGDHVSSADSNTICGCNSMDGRLEQQEPASSAVIKAYELTPAAASGYEVQASWKKHSTAQSDCEIRTRGKKRYQTLSDHEKALIIFGSGYGFSGELLALWLGRPVSEVIAWMRYCDRLLAQGLIVTGCRMCPGLDRDECQLLNAVGPEAGATGSGVSPEVRASGELFKTYDQGADSMARAVSTGGVDAGAAGGTADSVAHGSDGAKWEQSRSYGQGYNGTHSLGLFLEESAGFQAGWSLRKLVSVRNQMLAAFRHNSMLQRYSARHLKQIEKNRSTQIPADSLQRLHQELMALIKLCQPVLAGQKLMKQAQKWFRLMLVQNDGKVLAEADSSWEQELQLSALREIFTEEVNPEFPELSILGMSGQGSVKERFRAISRIKGNSSDSSLQEGRNKEENVSELSEKFCFPHLTHMSWFDSMSVSSHTRSAGASLRACARNRTRKSGVLSLHNLTSKAQLSSGHSL